MIILLDFSQIVISSTIEFFSFSKKQIDLPLLRHIALNNILSYKKKFNAQTNQLIICFDGKDYWRKDIFPLYKQNRKLSHDKSNFDWNEFFNIFNTIKDEIKNELPFKTIESYRCEADDIIAVLSKYHCPHQDKIIIISSDKDLIQIQNNICSKVQQWSPLHKKYISAQTNNYNLFEHVVKGDSGDGIPNILSDEDVFLDKSKRSKPIKSTNIIEWEKNNGLYNPERFCSSKEMLAKFYRNHTLIDLRNIPENLSLQIIADFNTDTNKRVDIFNYLVKNKLRKILESGLL